MIQKKIVVAIVGLLFGHHVICTILYNAPINPMTGSYQQYVTNYMEPIFTQKWLLFAPEPATSDLKFWYKIRYDGNWTTWFDPLEPILKKHQNMRFTYNAKLLYVYGNIPRELSIQNETINALVQCDEKDVRCMQSRNDSLFVSSEFKTAKRYVKEDIVKHSSYDIRHIDSIQMMIIRLYPKQFSERLTSKPFGFANSTEFPPVKFND